MPSGESAVLKERPKVKKRIKWKSGLLRALLYVVIILFGVTFAFPFFLTLMNSLKPLTASVGLSQIIPSEFHWENYYYAVTLIPFFKYLLNSLIIVAIVVPMCTIINMVIGYAFARLRARGKDVMFVIVLSTMMIPGIVTMIPQYILYNVLGITDTFFIYVLGNIGGGAYNIFLFKQFFSAMPGELEEAAKIDGAGTLQTIFRIFAPAAKPVIIIVAIGAFQGLGRLYDPLYVFLSREISSGHGPVRLGVLFHARGPSRHGVRAADQRRGHPDDHPAHHRLLLHPEAYRAGRGHHRPEGITQKLTAAEIHPAAVVCCGNMVQ